MIHLALHFAIFLNDVDSDQMLNTPKKQFYKLLNGTNNNTEDLLLQVDNGNQFEFESFIFEYITLLNYSIDDSKE
ncbi:CLUMA_CG019367, isoform A [Clunio marinus]|uniref:CLUMA_CG019367, isoform A n=1 Tax=Clunio marinus TaxID=568069 RepID=A0A1J1J2L1_9DIPT|nr:CLUMA_CG019367, isoform A [Clunio marinus]